MRLPTLRTLLRPRFSLRLLFVAMTLVAVLLAYVGRYVSRSVRGRYEPAAIGLNGVKWYDWAPEGFVTDYEGNAPLTRFYYPLWQLDRKFWHQPLDGGEKSLYPVDEVPADEIGKVYRAWGAFKETPPGD